MRLLVLCRTRKGSKLGPILPRQRVLEHYESHVMRCPDCQKGLRDLRQKQTAALIGSKQAQAGVDCVATCASAALNTKHDLSS